MKLPESVLHHRRLESLVENQTTYTMDAAELHVFETHQQAEQVLLRFDDPVLASMLEGKKVMHLENMRPFDFLPGESVILPAGETMCIDFPEARMDDPTRCLAMSISTDMIMKTIAYLNETRPKVDGQWKYTEENFHFSNDIALTQLIQRLIFLFTENHVSKDVFVNLILQELVIRILQTESADIYLKSENRDQGSERLHYIVDFIRQNLDQELSVKELSKKAYMSESNFYRVFKNELKTSPIEFINNERIRRATSLLHDPSRQIKDVYMECGFNSLSYFIRQFKKKTELSPREYQTKVAQS